MLKLVLLIVAMVIALAVGLAIALRDDPPNADMAGGKAAATPTAPSEFQAEAGATRVRITDDELTVEPRTVKLQDGYLTLQMENAASSSVELALVRGDDGADAVVAMPLDRGARRVDQVGVDAGTYTLLVREPGADDSPGRARVTLKLR